MIILGIDQARRSGWAVFKGAGIVASGFVYDTPGMVGVLDVVKAFADGDMTRVLVVFEDHSGIPLSAKARFARGHAPQRNTATILGIGAARGRWETALDLADHPERLRLSVEPQDWRARVLGLVPSASTERCKQAAGAYASQLIARAVTDDNEAEAVCIACWGSLDGVASLERERMQRRMRDRIKRMAGKQRGLPW